MNEHKGNTVTLVKSKTYRNMQMRVESKLRAATNDYFYFMFVPKYWYCFAKPDRDKTIVTDVRTNLPVYIS
jgi:hypothetical protein